MVDSDDSENEFYDALFKFSENELNGSVETAEKNVECRTTNRKNKNLSCQSHRTIVLFPGNSTKKTERSTFGIGIYGFLKIICESIFDNPLTSFFRKQTIVSKLTSKNEKPLRADNVYSVSEIVDVPSSRNKIDGKSREQVNIVVDSSRHSDKTIHKGDQLTLYGIDFNFSDSKRTNSNDYIDKSSKCTLKTVHDISKHDSDDLISTENKYTQNTENYSKNSLSANKIKNQYSQTSGKSSGEETVLKISSDIDKEELNQEASVFRDPRENNIKLLSTFEDHRERKLSDRYVSLETIQETLFPVDDKVEQNSTFHSQERISLSRNLNEYSEETASPYSYYHKNVHAMRLDCPKDNVRIKGDEDASQMKYNAVKNNKKDIEEVVYNPLSQLEKLLEIYTSHKINEELRQDSSSDMSEDDIEFDVEPDIFVELRHKSDRKSKNHSTPFLHSCSLPQKCYQNLCSERDNYDSENDEFPTTIKKVRKKIFSKKNSTQAHNVHVKDDSVKKASRCSHKRRKKTSAMHFDDTSFKVTGIKQKNKSSDKNKNKFRTTKMNKSNSVVKNIFNI